MGFEVQTEYPIPGGRLDVVWLLKPLGPIPHFDGALPIVAFEIESSWRSRKHVKGSLLNLHDCGASLGVIVLAGSSKADDSLRQFARQLVDRPGGKVLIWTEADLRALANGTVVTDLSITVDERIEGEEMERIPAAKEHKGKYRPLWEWLRNQERRPITVTFADVERILGNPLPDSARSHQAFWHGHSHPAGRAIIDAGWRARQTNLNAGTLTFVPWGGDD